MPFRVGSTRCLNGISECIRACAGLPCLGSTHAFFLPALVLSSPFCELTGPFRRKCTREGPPAAVECHHRHPGTDKPRPRTSPKPLFPPSTNYTPTCLHPVVCPSVCGPETHLPMATQRPPNMHLMSTQAPLRRCLEAAASANQSFTEAPTQMETIMITARPRRSGADRL